jgi:hypothetical protein
MGPDVLERSSSEEVQEASSRRGKWSLTLPLLTIVVAVVPVLFLGGYLGSSILRGKKDMIL